MAGRPHAIPRYCRHKASGQAVVRIDGIDHYLGPYGSPSSHERYERAIAERRAKQAEQPSAKQPFAPAVRCDLTVADVLYHYRAFAISYYQKDGKPSKELQAIRYSLRPVRQLYGSTRIRDFGPLALKAVREHMVAADPVPKSGAIAQDFRTPAGRVITPHWPGRERLRTGWGTGIRASGGGAVDCKRFRCSGTR